MRRPVDSPYTITTEFGVTDQYALYGKHSGYDYAVSVGTAVHATTAGKIVSTMNHSTRGYMVTLFDGKYYHRFMHNSKFNVGEGQQVNEGDVIAYSGGAAGAPGAGLSTGPHCHWDMNTRGVDTAAWSDFVDPDDWMHGRIPAADTPAPTPAPITDVLQSYQRRVASAGVNRRQLPSTSSAILGEWSANEVLDFKGYVTGESVAGNNIWYVGAYHGEYFWSGSFTDTGTAGLTDLTSQLFPPSTPPTPANPTPVTPDPTPQPTPTPGQVIHPDHSKHVIDISSNNNITDYQAMMAAVRGVIAKAGHTGKSYGGTTINSDPDFAASKSLLGDKLVGAYWYAYVSLDPFAEARAFLQTVGDVPATFTYWLDIEEYDGATVDVVNGWSQAFLETIEKAIGRKCGLYMNRDWYDNVIIANTKSSRPVWLAHFDTPELSNLVPNQVAHQFTSKGTIPGIVGNVDINAVTDNFFVTPDPVTPSNNLESRVQHIEGFLSSTLKNF